MSSSTLPELRYSDNGDCCEGMEKYVCSGVSDQLTQRSDLGWTEPENRIKEQQLDLFADRTSAHTMQVAFMKAEAVSPVSCVA